MNLSPNTQKKRLALFALLALLSTVICTVLRLWSLMQYYDTELGYYDAGAVLPVVGNVFLLLCAAGLLCFAAFGFSKKELALPAPSFGARLVAILPAAMALATVTVPLLTETKQTIVTLLPFDPAVLFRAASVLAVAMAVFFVLIAAGAFRNRKLHGILVLLGFLSILYFLITLAIAYFDFEIQMNSPNKLIFQLACLGAMLFLLAELRILADAQKPRFSLLAFALGTLVLGTSSLPSVIAYTAGIFPKDYTNLLPDLACVALFCYCTVRLIVSCLGSSEKVTEVQEATEIQTAAEANENTPEACSESAPSDPGTAEENKN